VERFRAFHNALHELILLREGQPASDATLEELSAEIDRLHAEAEARLRSMWKM